MLKKYIDALDNINVMAHEGIVINEVMYDIIDEIEATSVELERDKTYENMVGLAYETNRLIDRLHLLNTLAKEYLMQIDTYSEEVMKQETEV